MFDRMKGMLALPEDPMQNAAARQGLLTAGAALLGGRGNLGEILGGGLLAGSQGYQGGLAQQQQQQYRQAQTQQIDMENKRLQAAADEPMQLQRILSGGQSTPMGPPASLPRLGGAPAAGASFGAAPAPGSIAPQAPADQYATLMGYAERLTQAGRVAQAKPYYDMAEKLRPKLMKQEARMVDGQRVMANVFEDGRTERVDGFAPDAEKLNFQNTGGSTVALDPFTGKPVNTIRNSQSPDSVASNATAMRGQNMADRRAAESNENSRGVIIQTDQGPMLANSRTGTTKPILDAKGLPVTRTKTPTEFQGKSAAFGLRATEADKILNALKYSPAAINSKASVSSWPIVGGALGAATNKFGLTQSDQRAEQSQRDFINAVLRQESGAAIADSEFDNARKQYFPQPGDGADVIKQKARARQLSIQGLQMNAGHAALTAPPANGGGVTFLGFE
jgi:hypothetical protein